MKHTDLTEREKRLLFWASFLALAAAGFGFVFRVMLPDIWAKEFSITGEEAGSIAGAALWPIAITMIIFSLIIDKIGYKVSMLMAFATQALSVILTYYAKDANSLWWACFIAGLGHGIVEACINPLCASIYREEKSKMLNILHASWPAGIVAGGIIFLTLDSTLEWNTIFFFMLLPVLGYGVMFLMCQRFPEDERVEANVSTRDMLREFGGLGAFMAATFLFYELTNQTKGLLGIDPEGQFLSNLLYYSLGVGAVVGFIIGFALRSPGKILFFILCLLMIPLATAELATDGWIQSLMKPMLDQDFGIRSGWAIVASACIMMTLRFFAGVPLKFMSPPALLVVSSIFSIVGLWLLSGASGWLIFLAFACYGVGQTFYWPTVLGLVSEQFPKGGALTLNTVTALGLLTVGIFGFPFLGAVKDNFDAQTIKKGAPELYAKQDDSQNPLYAIKGNNFFGWKYDSVKTADLLGDVTLLSAKGAELKQESTMKEYLALKDTDRLNETGVELKNKVDNSARQTLKVAAVLPLIMAVCYGLIFIYFKLKGGYRTVSLDRSEEAEPGF